MMAWKVARAEFSDGNIDFTRNPTNKIKRKTQLEGSSVAYRRKALRMRFFTLLVK